MSNSVEYTKIDANSDTSTKTINYINTEASDSEVALFVASLNSLSKDTLTSIQRVEGEDVPTVPAVVTVSGGGASDTHVINLQRGAKFQTGAGNDSIINYGNSASIKGGRGNDTIINYGNSATLAAGDTSAETDDTLINYANDFHAQRLSVNSKIINYADNAEGIFELTKKNNVENYGSDCDFQLGSYNGSITNEAYACHFWDYGKHNLFRCWNKFNNGTVFIEKFDAATSYFGITGGYAGMHERGAKFTKTNNSAQLHIILVGVFPGDRILTSSDGSHYFTIPAEDNTDETIPANDDT